MSGRVLKERDDVATEGYTYDLMNQLTEVNRGGMADGFSFYSTANFGQPIRRWTTCALLRRAGPDLDTTDTVDPNANYQPPDIPEGEPAPPPDDYSDPPGGGESPAGFARSPFGDVLLGSGRQSNNSLMTVNGATATYTPNNINRYSSVTGCTVSNGSEHELSVFQGRQRTLNKSITTYVNDEHLKRVTQWKQHLRVMYATHGTLR